MEEFLEAAKLTDHISQEEMADLIDKKTDSKTL